MSHFAKSTAFLVACFVTFASLAQETCPDIVLEALASMETACASLGRNEVCYGNGSIVALDIAGEELSDFEETGDIAELGNVGSLSLSGLDEDAGLWGVAVLNVQANIPNTLPGQNVTMLLFGESELSTIEGDASAFVFSSGIGQLACQEAPNGLMIQTPEGVGTINLTINNVAIEMGSTAYLTAEAEGDFNFALLEGHATLTTEGNEIEVDSGEYTTISFEEGAIPTSELSEALPIEGNLELPQLPTSLLPRDINAESANSGEIITPRGGTWRFETTAVEVSAECPAMMASSIELSLADNNTLFDNFGGEDWDFETFYREATLESSGMEAPEGTYSSPEPNVYVFETDGSDVMSPYVFTLEVLSETEVRGQYFIDASQAIDGCTITVEFTATWSE